MDEPPAELGRVRAPSWGSPKSIKSSKIRELLITFEQQAMSPPSPHAEIRKSRYNLQQQLDQAIAEIHKQKKQLKVSQQEKTALLAQLASKETELQEQTAQNANINTKYTKLKEKTRRLQETNKQLLEQQEQTKTLLSPSEGTYGLNGVENLSNNSDDDIGEDRKAMEAIETYKSNESAPAPPSVVSDEELSEEDMDTLQKASEVDKPGEEGEKLVQEQNQEKSADKEPTEPVNDANDEKEPTEAVKSQEKAETPENSSENEEQAYANISNALSQEVEKLNNSNRDSLKIIDEYEEYNRKQANEIQELKHQLLSVLTLAERLELELNEEKEAHQNTRERFEKFKYTRSENAAKSNRSQSCTTAEVNSYVQQPSLEIPVSVYQTSQPVSPRHASKKKKRNFLSKFGKSQSKGDCNTSSENINQPEFPELPSPRQEKKREIQAGPQGKQQVQKMSESGQNTPVAMSDDQLQRELEVLLLLGETLQTELVNERKEHQATKKQLQELQSKLEEGAPRFNGVSNLIRSKTFKNSLTSVANSPTPPTPVHAEVDQKLAQELEKIDREQRFDMEEVSFRSSRMDIYDLKDVVSEMIAFTDLLLAPSKDTE